MPQGSSRTSPGASAFRPGAEDVRILLRLALPVVVVQVGMMLMGVVDTVMVGHVSPRDLAAVALGNLHFFAGTLFSLGVLFALDPLVSQAVGAGDRVAVTRNIQRGLVLALILSSLTILALLPARWLFTVLRQPAEVVPVAAGYVRVSIPGVVPFLVFVVFRQTLQAMGHVRPIVVTVVAANLANAGLNWALIYGNLGMPPMGAVGSGWASTLSRWLMAIALLVAAWPVLGEHVRSLRPEVLRRAPLERMLRLGLPVGVQFALEYGAFAAIAVLMGWLGTVAMAGHQIAINLASLTFMVPLGVSQATAVLVGQAVGAEDPPEARRRAGAGLAVGGGFMALTALAFLTGPGLLARVYSTDPAVVGLAVTLIPIAGVFQVFDGLQVVASAVLRGVGDTRAPMVINVLGFWLLGMPVSLLLGFRMGAGPVGLWWGLVAGLGVVAAALLARIRQRLGRELRRLVLEEG
ncbi:MAG: MATE family efflux transporter [Gemmatimonadetes bacterium]|nr:MATE family efflux transporter [Gemmatimonadota bacterium]